MNRKELARIAREHGTPVVVIDHEEQYVKIVLDAVLAVKQQFKQKHLINIILGKNTATIKSFKHNKTCSFRTGRR